MQLQAGHGINLTGVPKGVIDSCMAGNNGWKYEVETVRIRAFDSESVIIHNSVPYRNKSTSENDGDGFDLDGGT